MMLMERGLLHTPASSKLAPGDVAESGRVSRENWLGNFRAVSVALLQGLYMRFFHFMETG
jgi:hypothetical protein